MRKLQADNFRYPFQECDTPFQYAYRQMGRDDLADQHTYTIMAEQGRLDSFNQFMTGKYCKTRSESDRIKSLGYDLEAVLNERNPELVTMVDIGGSRGELLLDLKTTFPQLTRAELVVQEYNPDINDIPELTLMSWDYKAENSPQPIQGALIYHLSHVLHNLSDNEAVRLLQKVADAMESQSRLLIHEVVRTALTASLHCVMSVLFGGRERIRDDWHRLASEAGLKVTFEAYPSFGDGLIEMRRV
ncbi:S-adenosyl-L-methionine-dependent methyltransferase [Aspergillus avenaceus]|uniref:S-adenosyl-L-methionine-dependent methyltransferase n=1 Tax=Aspergillus avenaceus TaxID=36643 RepID=A0A5N6TZ43_ASPAV|nr:S-adenosyl-L-methionine-dependent methyltransferase [Aspergillus avenaceus]